MSTLIEKARTQFTPEEWDHLPERVQKTITAGRALAGIVAGHGVMRYRNRCIESDAAELRLAHGLDPYMEETLSRIAGKRKSKRMLNKTELLCLYLSEQLVQARRA